MLSVLKAYGLLRGELIVGTGLEASWGATGVVRGGWTAERRGGVDRGELMGRCGG